MSMRCCAAIGRGRLWDNNDYSKRTAPSNLACERTDIKGMRSVGRHMSVTHQNRVHTISKGTKQLEEVRILPYYSKVSTIIFAMPPLTTPGNESSIFSLSKKPFRALMPCSSNLYNRSILL